MNNTNYYNPSTNTIYTAKMLSDMGITTDPKVLQNLNLYPLEYNIPDYDHSTEKIVANNIAFDSVKNIYYQTFNVVQLTFEDMNLNDVINTENIFMKLRQSRDVRISSTTWLVERHREEQEMNIATTLSENEYNELLNYRQALRDITKLEGAPWDGGGPNTPWPTVPNFLS